MSTWNKKADKMLMFLALLPLALASPSAHIIGGDPVSDPNRHPWQVGNKNLYKFNYVMWYEFKKAHIVGKWFLIRNRACEVKTEIPSLVWKILCFKHVKMSVYLHLLNRKSENHCKIFCHEASIDMWRAYTICK